MITILKKYSAFVAGFLITIILGGILYYQGIILIDRDEYLTIILLFVIWWLIISWPIYKFSYLKKHRHFILRSLGLISFLILSLILDNYLQIPDNPISILSIVLLCTGVLYLIAPGFVNKYRTLILGFFSLVFCYFLLIRILMYDSERYEEYKDIFLLMFFISIPLIIAIWFYEQWKWLKNLKSEKAMAELAMLKSQVNPHFFFNTLNNLHALTVTHSEKAPEVILKLSEMMRYTIYEGKKDRVLLKEEIDYLENYIALHQIRHHKRVAINFEQTVTDTVMIAPMLLIVLLENAFKHGVEQLTEKAYINLQLRADEKKIQFMIENSFDELSERKAPGIGLENLKRRLSLIYPDQYQLNITETGNIYRSELTLTPNS